MENYDADNEIDTSDSDPSSCDSLTCQNAAAKAKKPTKEAPPKKAAPASTGEATQLSIGQFAVPRSETVVFGKQDLNPNSCPHRQYLLLLNSSALREFFRKKDSYIEAARKAGAELEFTRLIATLKDTDWPKYQLIEIRAPTEDRLNSFDQQLLTMNPDYKEKVPYDANKYTCVQSACRFSSYVASDLNGSTSSTEDDDAGGQKKKAKKKAEEPSAAAKKDAGKKQQQKGAGAPPREKAKGAK